MSEPARILVVEDEAELAAGIAENLTAEGYLPVVVSSGPAALGAARDGDYDLVILDVMLPQMDGFAVCRSLREAGDEVPVLFLTARGDPQDRVRGLEEGGDDYMAKPFHLRELLLRVAAILRRGRWYRRTTRRAPVLRFGDNEVDFRTYRGRSADGRDHDLSHKEAHVLRVLAERPGEVVSRDEILDRVWGYEAFPSSRTIDNFILRLRRRFEPDPRAPVFFRTVHGAGYRFVVDPSAGGDAERTVAGAGGGEHEESPGDGERRPGDRASRRSRPW